MGVCANSPGTQGEAGSPGFCHPVLDLVCPPMLLWKREISLWIRRLQCFLAPEYTDTSNLCLVLPVCRMNIHLSLLQNSGAGSVHGQMMPRDEQLPSLARAQERKEVTTDGRGDCKARSCISVLGPLSTLAHTDCPTRLHVLWHSSGDLGQAGFFRGCGVHWAVPPSTLWSCQPFRMFLNSDMAHQALLPLYILFFVCLTEERRQKTDESACCQAQ